MVVKDVQWNSRGPCSLEAYSVAGREFRVLEAILPQEEITIVPINCVKTVGMWEMSTQGQGGLTRKGYLRRMELSQ